MSPKFAKRGIHFAFLIAVLVSTADAADARAQLAVIGWGTGYNRGAYYGGFYPYYGVGVGGYYGGFYPYYGIGSYGYSYPSQVYGYPTYEYAYGYPSHAYGVTSYGKWAYSSPSDNTYYYSSSPGAPRIQGSASASGTDDIAHIMIQIPDPNADVVVDGKPTTSTGSVRYFQTPPLSPGKYTYQVQATWEENGKKVTKSRNGCGLSGAPEAAGSECS